MARPHRLRHGAAWLAALTCASTALAATSTCDAVRTSIESKIKASGTVRFTLRVVDADAAAAGKVVGTCDQGSRKIVYQRGDAPEAGASAASTAAAPSSPAARTPPRRGPAPPILTECKDGTVSRGGDCRK